MGGGHLIASLEGMEDGEDETLEGDEVDVILGRSS